MNPRHSEIDAESAEKKTTFPFHLQLTDDDGRIRTTAFEALAAASSQPKGESPFSARASVHIQPALQS
jgi:hypothetical protein